MRRHCGTRSSPRRKPGPESRAQPSLRRKPESGRDSATRHSGESLNPGAIVGTRGEQVCPCHPSRELQLARIQRSVLCSANRKPKPVIPAKAGIQSRPRDPSFQRKPESTTHPVAGRLSNLGFARTPRLFDANHGRITATTRPSGNSGEFHLISSTHLSYDRDTFIGPAPSSLGRKGKGSGRWNSSVPWSLRNRAL
jgi:hypothetical protein